MPESFEVYHGPLLIYLLVVTRLAGLVAGAPLAVRGLPVRLRILLAAGVALLITPLHLPAVVALPTDWISMGMLLANELTLGLAQGLVIMILVAGLQLAGQLMSQMSGMQIADVFHPDLGAKVPVMARLLELVTLAVFLATGGHRQVMACLLDSFRWMPPGRAVVSSDLILVLADVMRNSFELGIRAAAPVVVSLLISILTLGFISRTIPQLNVLAVGFSVHVIVMLAALFVSLGTIVLVFEQSLATSLDQLQQALAQAPGVP